MKTTTVKIIRYRFDWLIDATFYRSRRFEIRTTQSGPGCLRCPDVAHLPERRSEACKLNDWQLVVAVELSADHDRLRSLVIPQTRNVVVIRRQLWLMVTFQFASLLTARFTSLNEGRCHSKSPDDDCFTLTVVSLL